ncbi:hypothetical protein GH5_02030 [Leishmania sp. Ghana 2012 LV757]|uniref:hypothetical protein n=1 Tax=Leishmania sp. Ghana 2012 LV757 TaxID=2803181 RepID=UPI001B6E52BD|nr:hypothetical protein GH5_02030 [Leishmania sp. Ghana 2012 LV757]
MSRSRHTERRESRRERRKESRHSVKKHHHHRSSGSSSRHRHSVISEKPPVPRDFHCHICGKAHWTVYCDRLQRHPEHYPLMDAERGCRQCGQQGHSASQCRIKKYLCRDCGGMHDTRDCAFAHVGEDWYEFFDPKTRHVYYANSDESQIQWNPPTHELDTVYWYCSRCQVMISAKFRECLLCHSIRPESKPQETLTADSDSSISSSSSASSSSSGEGDSSYTSGSSSSSSSSGSDSVFDSSSSDDDDEQGQTVKPDSRAL